VRKNVDLINRIDSFNSAGARVSACESFFLNFSVRMRKNHNGPNFVRSIPKTFAQKGQIELKNGESNLS